MLSLQHPTKQIWTWFARVGIGPKFGSRPIGWYQVHMGKAEKVLAEKLLAKGAGHGAQLHAISRPHNTGYDTGYDIYARPCFYDNPWDIPIGAWRYIASAEEIYREADKRE